MGILPLQFAAGETAESLGLSGEVTYTLEGLDKLETGGKLTVTATDAKGGRKQFTATVRLDTPMELAYYRDGGILPYVLNQLLSPKGALPASIEEC
jgi:aconitate hydratase